MKFFDTALKIEFQRYKEDDLAFLSEFNQMNNNALNTWKKLALKVSFSEEEELLFKLLLSLKEDVLRLEDKIYQRNSLLELEHKSQISGIAFDGLKLQDECLETEALYYARIEINHQLISFFFKALNSNQALITEIKREDKGFYDVFVVEMQRRMINATKGQGND